MVKSINLKNVNTFKEMKGQLYQLHFDLSFDLKENQTAIIFGRSGNGKTLFANFLEDTKSFTFDGTMENSFEKIIYQGQNKRSSISKSMSLKDYISMHTNGQNIKQIIELFEMFSLTYFDVIIKNPYDLSGGEFQRFNTIISLLSKPDLLILDEPSSALDDSNLELLMKGLKKIQSKTKLAIIIISHDNKFRNMGTNIYEMKHGHLTKLK